MVLGGTVSVERVQWQVMGSDLHQQFVFAAPLPLRVGAELVYLGGKSLRDGSWEWAPGVREEWSTTLAQDTMAAVGQLMFCMRVAYGNQLSPPARVVPVIRVPATPAPGEWGPSTPRGCFAPLPATVKAAAALDPPPDAMAAVAAFSDGQSGVWAVASDSNGRVSVTVVLTELTGGGLVDDPLGHPQSTEPVCYHGGSSLDACMAEWAEAEAAARDCLRGL